MSNFCAIGGRAAPARSLLGYDWRRLRLLFLCRVALVSHHSCYVWLYLGGGGCCLLLAGADHVCFVGAGFMSFFGGARY